MAGPFYVQPGIGNDGNAGTSRGAGNSWATLQKALDTAVAGEIVYCEGTETLSADCNVDTNSGTVAGGYIQIIGTNTSGVNDGTKYVIDCNSGAYGLVFGSYYMTYWENVRVTNTTTHAWEANGGPLGHIFLNCQADNAGGWGWETGFAQCLWIKCLAYACSSGFSAYQYNHFVFCTARDNTNKGFDQSIGPSVSYTGCISHGNGTIGWDLEDSALLFNCVADGNGTIGIDSDPNSFGNHIIATRVTNQSGTSDIGINLNSLASVYGWNYYEDNDGANIQNATYGIELKEDGSATDIEDQADTNEGYTNIGSGTEDFNLRSDASQRRTAVKVPF